ncbi:hypothetical protein ACFFF5_15560 [Lederbergia wuyishanensis]|uniref:Flagellar hook-length control protein-like C-terminal domain-containing protein n=1 Tax=Lederbergia wuyishanensis TaxID=1347903 RepID=A0ABU0D902_9BACI|nr:hypothetical protein [Lederbergia wuyishanensis]MCJ8007587.1 hypothetical protein [Lederbergia wuyishanensis]MDQ0344830.1 hypothetical protein [Lederbergia wuyishanensis]
MQIQNDTKATVFPQTDLSVNLKEGGTYTATVTEKLPNNEAIVQVKGQDMHVKFEGNVPDAGKITLQVTDMGQNLPIVKAVAAQTAPSVDKGAAGLPLPENIRQAIQVLNQYHIPISRETLKNIRAYIEKGPGTPEQKLETIINMAKKQLDFTPQQIKAVHEALHGRSLGEVLNELVKEMDPEFKVQNPSIFRSEATLEFHQTGQTQVSGSSNALQVALQEALKQVKTSPNLSMVLQFMKGKQELLETVHHAVERAEQLHASGRELAARQELATALINFVENEPPEKEAEFAYRISNEIIATIPVQSRDLIVTTITKKLSQAAIDFKNIKRDITNTLRVAENLIKQAPVQVRQPLEAVIKQLDNAILKSDFMLYTDMGTEKKLMQASSQLHEARKLLGKGEFSKASEIVHQVRDTVDKLIFQPSDQRVKHFVSKELLNLERQPLEKEILRAFNEPYQTLRQEPGARHALEYIRRLGITYDSDIAHRLVSGDGSGTDAEASLKNSLLRLIQAEGNNPRVEQALNNLTGQQLMSKTDNSGLQTMLFTLPIILRDQLENVKVFLKSNQSKQKIDWENCSLYFLLETKRMGDVGIQLTSIDKTLSVTVKNDRLDFQNKMEPLVKTAKGRLEDIGYKIGTIQFSRLTPTEKTEERKEQSKNPSFTERGYDFSV